VDKIKKKLDIYISLIRMSTLHNSLYHSIAQPHVPLPVTAPLYAHPTYHENVALSGEN